jgi:hypothetical protein
MGTAGFEPATSARSRTERTKPAYDGRTYGTTSVIEAPLIV